LPRPSAGTQDRSTSPGKRVAIHDWTFLLGPGFCVGVNGILLGWLMYRKSANAASKAASGITGARSCS
jgi:hypothetical protein